MKRLFSSLVILSFILLLLGSCREEPVQPQIDAIYFSKMLKVSSPKFDDRYNPGDQLTISWVKVEQIKKIDIQLFKKNQFISKIVSEVNNTGDYVWTIPPAIQQSHHYQIRVSNHNEPYEEAFSEVFFILRN
jgi:hypothetical protein